MKSIVSTALVACFILAATATSSFATPTGGTTLAGMHNGMHAKRRATMSKHRKMMHRKMTRSGKKM